jgi:DNA-binding LytR/AlgR family response regulator
MENKNSIIWVKTSSYKKKVMIDSILFCKAAKKKVDIYLYPESTQIPSSNSLAYLEDLLPADKFCRCNRQCIINIDQVEQYSLAEVILINGTHVSVARDRKKGVISQLDARYPH